MGTLLERAVMAHGGIDNWTKFRTASAAVDIGGAVWHLKGQPDLFKGIELTASLRHQHLVTTAMGAGWRGTFTPDLARVESPDGHVTAVVEHSDLKDHNATREVHRLGC